MTYSKAADEIIRELNGLIIQAREAAAHTREQQGGKPVPDFYNPFWEFIAAQAETMTDELSTALSSVTELPQQPEGIFTRFRIIKAIEDTVFRAHITAFQARLTACRAAGRSPRFSAAKTRPLSTASPLRASTCHHQRLWSKKPAAGWSRAASPHRAA